MFSIHGFARIDAIANNINSVVAPIGEIAPSTMSFSKEKSFFGNSNLGDVSFVGFSCKDENSPATITTTQGNEITLVLNWLYETAKTITLPESKSEIILLLTAEFEYLSDFNVGESVITPTLTMPEWIYFKNVLNGGTSYEVKVWFSNNAFVGQYPLYEIVVIPPIADIDIFFSNFTTVNSYLLARNTEQLTEAIQTASGGYPYTYLKTINYDWVSDPTNNITLPTNWTVIIYGAVGNNSDSIKNAIRDYILANTEHPEQEWEVLFPSIFRSNEFIITPHWDRRSNSNQTLESSLYSSIFSVDSVGSYARLTKGNYATTHVNLHACGSFFTYKSVAFSAIGNPVNINSDYNLFVKFKDYLPVPSTSTDFARMSLKTQRWSNLMNELLPIAESMTNNSSVPLTMTRIIRGPYTFVAKSLDGMLYLVATKASLPSI